MIGISTEFAFYLVSIANAGSGFGRILSGVLSDKFGNLNVLTPFSVMAAIFTVIWPWCTTKWSLIAIGALYGWVPSPVSLTTDCDVSLDARRVHG